MIYETVLEHLKTDLLKGKLQPGDRLPTVAAYAETLGVNQASVREAYRVLETLGILNMTQGRGTFIATTFDGATDALNRFELAEQQSVQHLLEARKLLEPAVAALAAARASGAEAEAILQAAGEMERLYKKGKDFIEPDVRFHELIFYAAHNAVLARMMMSLNDLLLDSRRLTSRLPDATEKAVSFHKLIGLAIKDHNSEMARTLMQEHVEDVARSLSTP